MNNLRNFVYDLAISRPALVALGLSAANVYPVYSRDSTPAAIEGDRFLILRWGPAEPGVGPVVPVGLDIWAYDRSPEYSWIMDILRAFRPALEESVGAPLSEARADWMNGVNWQGSTPDLFDDMYNAYTRSESYRLVASGS